MTAEEVAGCFPEQQEGSPEDWPKELCKRVAKERHEVLGSLGKRHSQMCFHSFLQCISSATLGSENQSKLILCLRAGRRYFPSLELSVDMLLICVSELFCLRVFLCIHHMLAWFLQRPEESIRSPGSSYK